MGFLGGDNDQGRGEELAEEQLAMNKAELEEKKNSLYQTRLDIIKGQGGQNWAPDRSGKSKQGSATAKIPTFGLTFKSR